MREPISLRGELLLSDHVRYFAAFHDRRIRCEGFEAKHWARPAFDKPVILFNPIFEIFRSNRHDFARQPKRAKILLTSLNPVPFAPLILITIRNGIPLLARVFAKNYVAAAVLRCSEAMESSVFPSRH